MKFLQFSDIHYCPRQAGRISMEIWESLPSYIAEKNFDIDEIFFTGDYRHAKLQAKQDEGEILEDSTKIIQQIISASGITDMKHVHIIPGNHDRGRMSKEEYDEIRLSYSAGTGIINSESKNKLEKQFSFFYSLCDNIYGEINPWKNRPIHTYSITKDAVVFYLNTALMHNSSNDRGNLILGNYCLYQILREVQTKAPSLPKIVLAHHSIEYFNDEERRAIESIFRDYPIRLYLCGDAHAIWWRSINGYPEITMGTLQIDSCNAQSVFLYGDTSTETYSAYEFRGMFSRKYAWAPFEQFNKSFSQECLCKKRPSINKRPPSIKKQDIEKFQKFLLNDCILPWLKHSVSYKAIFPKVFMKPLLYDEKLKKPILFDELATNYTKKNIVFIGKAGFGKSTLLRYFFLFKNDNCEFLYLRAQVLEMTTSDLSSYDRKVLSYLKGEIGSSKHRVIIVDGMDELFSEVSKEINSIIAYHASKNSNINIWFGWRSEYNKAYESEPLRYFTDHIISLQKWEIETAIKYVNIYSNETSRPELSIFFKKLIDRNPAFKGFTESPFQLVMLVYLLENNELKIVGDYFNNSEPSLYSLYALFVECWIKKEQSRNTSTLPLEDILNILEDVAYYTYSGKSYIVSTTDSAVKDILVFSNVKDSVAIGFYHRSFSAFFCAKRIYNALKRGDKSLVFALKQSYKNDVTDFVRSALSNSSKESLICVFNNLKKIYLHCINPKAEVVDKEILDALNSITQDELKKMKNELLYIVTRLPIESEIVAPFVEFVYTNETDPHMRLDLAYGAVLTGPSWIALEYARALREDAYTSLINRSWTIVYFGDVQEDPYEYRDTEGRPWTQARNARLKHLQSSSKKAVRFRILEIPLLYCFYSSRNWKDINERDYEIIKASSIDSEYYSEEEKLFLRQQKNELLNEYRKKLDEKGF